MGTLYVDEGGAQRAFRVSGGTLAVGSGENAKLRLASSDVAEIHAELEIAGDDLFITPRPGVLPPKIHGVAVEERVRVAPGQELRIGGARLVWRRDADSDAAPAARAAPASRPMPRPAPRVRSSVTVRRAPARRRGLPGWALAVLGIGVVGFVVFVVLQNFQGNLEDAERTSTQYHLRRSGELLQERNADAAEVHLAKIIPSELSSEELELVEGYRETIRESRAAAELALENARGDTWFEFMLEDYEKRYLGGAPELPVVRVFLERTSEFRERWPEHPKLSWIDRQERRFSKFPGLDGPLTYADVEWKAKVFTNARPRDYASAFELLYTFRETADGEDKSAVDELVAGLRRGRETYHADQLRYAQAEYEKGNRERAFEWLVMSILRLGDETMENEAAEILVDFPGADALLRGYHRDRADDFEALMQNVVVAEFAQKNGIR